MDLFLKCLRMETIFPISWNSVFSWFAETPSGMPVQRYSTARSRLKKAAWQAWIALSLGYPIATILSTILTWLAEKEAVAGTEATNNLISVWIPYYGSFTLRWCIGCFRIVWCSFLLISHSTRFILGLGCIPFNFAFSILLFLVSCCRWHRRFCRRVCSNRWLLIFLYSKFCFQTLTTVMTMNLSSVICICLTVFVSSSTLPLNISFWASTGYSSVPFSFAIFCFTVANWKEKIFKHSHKMRLTVSSSANSTWKVPLVTVLNWILGILACLALLWLICFDFISYNAIN